MKRTDNMDKWSHIPSREKKAGFVAIVFFLLMILILIAGFYARANDVNNKNIPSTIDLNVTYDEGINNSTNR